MTVIATRGLTHLYSKGTPFQVAAIKDINIEIEHGELVGIIGHTGSGKSTLIQQLNGILKPEKGTVLLEGQDIWASKASIRQARFKVGLCFQYPEYQLFEETVYKDIAFGPRNMKLDEEEINRRVHKATEFVGLKEEHLSKSPFDLSGGEKRRAAIAGVMAMEPMVLIMDEPTAGLDPHGRDLILNLIKEYREDTGNTVMLVSHSMEDVAQLASTVLVLENAQVAMSGTVEEVYSRGEELSKMGLSVPQVTRIFAGLRERGLDVDTNIFTLEQGRQELLRFLGKGVPV
ncbi:MAG: energy-coupling factor transporter ATPase [Clostridiales bacterium]|nr:energy-coupling factor transporter ATPase [Clostridiales bacterium]